jgi:hypothetical protein
MGLYLIPTHADTVCNVLHSQTEGGHVEREKVTKVVVISCPWVAVGKGQEGKVIPQLTGSHE